jgi:hypothetical protein
VPALRLDDYALDRVGFIKIDVEGHELAVLKGAEATIRGSMPSLLVEIEERHSLCGIQNVTAFLTGLRYEGFFVLKAENCSTIERAICSRVVATKQRTCAEVP